MLKDKRIGPLDSISEDAFCKVGCAKMSSQSCFLVPYKTFGQFTQITLLYAAQAAFAHPAGINAKNYPAYFSVLSIILVSSQEVLGHTGYLHG